MSAQFRWTIFTICTALIAGFMIATTFTPTMLRTFTLIACAVTIILSIAIYYLRTKGATWLRRLLSKLAIK